MNDTEQSQKTYVCMGTCQAVVSQEQYDNGLTHCGAETCTMHGKALVRGTKSPTGENIAEDASTAT